MILPSRALQTNFTSGELSPRLRGRVDLEQYGDGAAVLQNFQVLNAGGITRRPGSGFCGAATQDAGYSRLIPFVVSNLTAYVLELSDLSLRIWRNRGQVIGTDGNPLLITTPWARTLLRDLRFDQSADVMYLTHQSVPTQKLVRTAANAFSLQPVAFVNGPYDVENTGDIGSAGPGPAAGTVSGPDSGTVSPPVLTMQLAGGADS